MNHSSMVGHILEAVWTSPPAQLHPAWVDETSAAISTAVVNLALAGAHPVQVSPCEVSMRDAYPALGIELRELSHPLEVPEDWPEGCQPLEQLGEIQKCLPAAIAEVRVWDALGEGPDSAIQFILATGLTLTVRHQYPPMTLGVDIAHSGE